MKSAKEAIKQATDAAWQEVVDSQADLERARLEHDKLVAAWLALDRLDKVTNDPANPTTDEPNPFG